MGEQRRLTNLHHKATISKPGPACEGVGVPDCTQIIDFLVEFRLPKVNYKPLSFGIVCELLSRLTIDKNPFLVLQMTGRTTFKPRMNRSVKCKLLSGGPWDGPLSLGFNRASLLLL